MQLVTIFVVCPVDVSPSPLKEKIGTLLNLTLEDPRAYHTLKNLQKVLYWPDLKFSAGYDMDSIIRQISSEFQSFVVYHISHSERLFHEKNGWWLGIVSSVVIGVFFALFGLYR